MDLEIYLWCNHGWLSICKKSNWSTKRNPYFQKCSRIRFKKQTKLLLLICLFTPVLESNFCHPFKRFWLLLIPKVKSFLSCYLRSLIILDPGKKMCREIHFVCMNLLSRDFNISKSVDSKIYQKRQFKSIWKFCCWVLMNQFGSKFVRLVFLKSLKA